MPKYAQGFTFIELTLVISVIGVLAAVAIPAYTDYLKRAQISEAMLLTTNVRLAVADYYAYRGEFPQNNRQAGVLEPAQLRGTYVAEILVDKGHIQARFFDSAIPGGVEFTPVTVPEYPARLYWRCESKTIPRRYLLRTCKESSP